MSRKRAVRWALALVIGLGARVVVAAPAGSTAELRAAACCGTHCPSAPRRPMQPHRCCFVGSPAADPASMAAAPSVAPPVLTALAVAPATPAWLDRHVLPGVVDPTKGPPGHLETLRLRR